MQNKVLSSKCSSRKNIICSLFDIILLISLLKTEDNFKKMVKPLKILRGVT